MAPSEQQPGQTGEALLVGRGTEVGPDEKDQRL
jgi:hypothetical protein